jgi:hypothetical protein
MSHQDIALDALVAHLQDEAFDWLCLRAELIFYYFSRT